MYSNKKLKIPIIKVLIRFYPNISKVPRFYILELENGGLVIVAQS